jgi:DNA-binding transcriptional ArsR family regulator
MVQLLQRAAGDLDDVFGALSDSTRRAMVERLAVGRASVSELGAPFPISLPAVMKHVRVLEGAGLVRHHKEGRTRWCELVGDPLGDAEGWLARYRVFWDHRLDALVEHFEREGSAVGEQQ